MDAQTLPQFFLRQVQTQPADKVALRQKEFGIWREFTWAASYEQARALGMGLIALGARRGDTIATVGDNDRFHLWGYLGLQAIGAAQVGLFTDATPAEMAYVIDHSDAAFVLAKDQEQCDKLLEMRAQIPKVRRVIYWDERGLWNYDEPWLLPFAEAQALGRALIAREPDRFETEVALGTSDDQAMLCYTSGTTGRPKGVVLSHDNILSAIRVYHAVDPRRDSDNHVSFLPMGWIAEPILGVAAHVFAGLILNFPEEPETVRQNIREIAPDMLFYNSRLWDSLVGTVQVRMNDATWLNRTLYRRFLPIGYRMADARFGGRPAGAGVRAAYALGDRLVDDVLGKLGQPPDVRLAGAEVTALHGVGKETPDRVALVGVVLGGVDTALGGDRVGATGTVLEAEALDPEALGPEARRAGRAGQPGPDHDHVLAGPVARTDQGVGVQPVLPLLGHRPGRDLRIENCHVKTPVRAVARAA